MPTIDFAALFAAVPDLYLVLDANLIVVGASDAYLRAMMRERAQVIGVHVFTVFPDAAENGTSGNDALRASVERLLESKCPDQMPIQSYGIPRADGSGIEEKHWLAVNIPILSDTGELQLILHRAEDVTARMMAEREGAETELRLRTLLATLPCMVYRSAAEEPWPIETISAACQQITGYTPDEFLSDQISWASLIHPEDTLLRVESAPIEPAFGFTASEYRIIHRDGTVRWVEDHHRTLQLPEGLFVDGVVYEVTQRKAADDEIRRSRLAAEAATHAKSAFLASMSHEIRTPMNAIIGMTSILLDTELSQDQRDAAEVIRSSGEHLLTLINDILDYSKIEAGKIELERAVFSVRDCIESAIDIAAGAAAKKQVELGYLMDAGAPERAIGDVGRLRQILVNLMSNAVKFTASGGQVFVEVTSHPGDPTSDVRELEFSVKDDGIGIGPEAQERLFQPFEQADLSTTRMHGGTGLGLSISRRLTELMDGRIWVDSELGQGSTFHFTAKVHKLAGSGEYQLPYFAVPAIRGRRVLIVDDLEINRRVLRHYVELWGMQPVETESSREALAWIERGDSFDIALLDYMMPELDGVVLARSIRALRTESQLPILILSSATNDLPALSGVAEALLKPIKPSRLLEAVSKALAQATPAARSETTGFSLPKQLGVEHPLRILVAEDNAMNQKLAKMLFGKMGYQPDFVGDGKEAVEAVQRQTYDVVFMDVLMPIMDGLDATREICRRHADGRPRIVGMSANAMSEDRRTAEAAGMDDYVPKPVPVDLLVAALKRCTRRA